MKRWNVAWYNHDYRRNFNAIYSPILFRPLNVKFTYCFFALALACASGPVQAQTSHDQAEARAIYQQANTDAAAATMRTTLSNQKTGFYGGEAFKPGALRTFDGRYRPVPGLRFHAGLHVLEARDSIDTEITHIWPVGSLRGFDVGEAGGTGPDAPRRFRPRLVKEGSAGTRRDFVEVLTTVDGGPLLLAWLYSAGADTPAARLSLAPVLLVGPGSTFGTDPLRPIELTQSAVLKLFGARAEAVKSFAATQNLTYDRPADVAHMLDYYNRVAVVK